MCIHSHQTSLKCNLEIFLNIFHVYGYFDCESQKRVSDPGEQELQTVVSQCVGCRGLKPQDSPDEQYVLLTTGLALQLLNCNNNNFKRLSTVFRIISKPS